MRQVLFRQDTLGTSCFLTSRVEGVDFERRFIAACETFSERLFELDQVASRFRQDSEVMRLSAENAGEPVSVSELLFDLVEAAMRAATITDGYLDPTVGNSMVGLGYSKDFELVRRDSADGMHFQVVLPSGYRTLVLDRVTRSISVPPGTILDLGATAKALVADRICAELEHLYSLACLINHGGDISCSYVGQEFPWMVNLTSDGSLDPTSDGMLFGIAGGGLATSSVHSRNWLAGGKSHHHIIDPTNGESAVVDFESITVLAGSALDANIASCGTVAMGHRGLVWLRGMGLPAVVKRTNRTQMDGIARPWNGSELEFIGDWPEELVQLSGGVAC